MSWNVEFTDEFGDWYEGIGSGRQDDVDQVVGLLEIKGPNLPFPYSSGIKGSKHDHMRELRVQSGGNPVRIFYAFDLRRTAILLSAATRPAMIDSTSRRSRSPTGFTTSIWTNSDEKD